MLERLYIENVAVIEKAEVDFDVGFNVLTGETGAGKSILIDSINAVLGGRTSRELIRTGTQKAYISAEFTDISESISDFSDELGFPSEDGGIILSREIKEDGKTSCRINGRPTTVSVLKEIGKRLINIHGQHETTALTDPSTHIKYVDAVAENDDIKSEYKKSYKKYTEIENALAKLNDDTFEKERRADALRFQIDELEKANLTVGEMNELTEQCNVLQNFEQINSTLTVCHELLSGDENNEGACSAVSSACSQLDSISDVCQSVAGLSARLADVSYELEDISLELRNELSLLEFEPELLNEIESRMNVLQRIFKKYGSEEDALAYLSKAKRELDSIENSDEIKKELTHKLKLQEKELLALADKLSFSRKKAAIALCENIKRELIYLDMPSVVIEPDIKLSKPTSDGQDIIELLISTNAGEPPKPLAKIASGGELSRIMLAFKTVLADKDDIDTLIFDEIDTGISGKASNKVGEKIRQVSSCRQIICITHSAQIAAKAGKHIFIQKEVENGRTLTKISDLAYDGRKLELARLIGGDSITDAVLSAAAEMLEQ